jgi:hypothetical protein
MTLRKQDRSVATWIDLNEAIRLAVRLAGEDEKLVKLMYGPNWQFYDHPKSLRVSTAPPPLNGSRRHRKQTARLYLFSNRLWLRDA